MKAAEQTTVEYADGVLRIHTHAAKNQYFGPSGSLEVTVALPAGSRVEAKTASTSYGRVSNGLKNNGVAELDIHATTAYGDIAAHSL